MPIGVASQVPSNSGHKERQSISRQIPGSRWTLEMTSNMRIIGTT